MINPGFLLYKSYKNTHLKTKNSIFIIFFNLCYNLYYICPDEINCVT